MGGGKSFRILSTRSFHTNSKAYFIDNCERFFLITFALSMVNTRLSLFSRYSRKFLQGTHFLTSGSLQNWNFYLISNPPEIDSYCILKLFTSFSQPSFLKTFWLLLRPLFLLLDRFTIIFYFKFVEVLRKQRKSCIYHW